MINAPAAHPLARWGLLQHSPQAIPEQTTPQYDSERQIAYELNQMFDMANRNESYGSVRTASLTNAHIPCPDQDLDEGK